MLKSLLAAAVIAVSVGSACATSFVVGTLPVAPLTYSNIPSVAPGSFTDLYSFVFPSGAVTGSGAAVSIDVGSVLDISGMQLALLDAGQAVLATGAAGDASFLTDVPMTAGSSYSFRITGNAVGSAGGTYAFLASASPIPEPGTLAVFVAGLAAVGSLVRRRQTH